MNTQQLAATSDLSAEAAERIMARCDELATISASQSGILRTYLSPEHQAHNALAADWMRQSLSAATTETTVYQDAAGNQCARLEGREPGLPALLIGSHLDTVPDAGRYDGIVGVLSGIELLQRLAPKADTLPFAVELVAFAEEEGTRFGATLLGSRAVAGTWDEALWDIQDAHGVTLAEAFRTFGLDPQRIGDAARRREDLIGYLELHIEQGPYLEAAEKPLGVVTSIAGARRFTITITGEARHAGGTPYEKRQDALIGASNAVLECERIGRAHGAIATVGMIAAEPGAVNVVPGRAEFSLDLRAAEDSVRDAAWADIQDSMQSFCASRGLQVHAREFHNAPTVYCAPRMQQAVRAGIMTTGDDAPMELFSRAGHDAMAIAAVTEIGMIFTRCRDGISHHPDESVLPTDIADGLDALEATVAQLITAKLDTAEAETTAETDQSHR